MDFSPVSKGNDSATQFCNFLNEKLLGKDQLWDNIFQMHLHWPWGEDLQNLVFFFLILKTEKLCYVKYKQYENMFSFIQKSFF